MTRSIALLLLMTIAGCVQADSAPARCDLYPAGEDQASAMVACTFSQRQGFISIDREDGVRHELAPTGDAPGNFTDQEGRAVFKFAVTKMAEVSLSLLERNGLTGDDIKLFVPHQANLRIISATAQRLGLPAEKVMVNIDRYANTTAGTVPIALSEAHKEGRLQPGDLVLLTAVGGGLTWGSALFRWAI